MYQRIAVGLAGAALAVAIPAGIASATPSNNGNFDEPVHSTGPETNIGPDGGSPPLDSQTGGDQPFELNSDAGSFDGFVRGLTCLREIARIDPIRLARQHGQHCAPQVRQRQHQCPAIREGFFAMD